MNLIRLLSLVKLLPSARVQAGYPSKRPVLDLARHELEENCHGVRVRDVINKVKEERGYES
jgi:hypothetical protein